MDIQKGGEVGEMESKEDQDQDTNAITQSIKKREVRPSRPNREGNEFLTASHNIIYNNTNLF